MMVRVTAIGSPLKEYGQVGPTEKHQPSTITHADCLTKVICIDAKAVRIEFWDSAHYVLPKQSAAVMV